MNRHPKKKFSLVLSLILICALAIVSCNNVSDTDISADEKAEVEAIEKKIEEKQKILKKETKETKEAIDALLDEI